MLPTKLISVNTIERTPSHRSMRKVTWKTAAKPSSVFCKPQSSQAETVARQKNRTVAAVLPIVSSLDRRWLVATVPMATKRTGQRLKKVKARGEMLTTLALQVTHRSPANRKKSRGAKPAQNSRAVHRNRRAAVENQGKVVAKRTFVANMDHTFLQIR